jgi:hypothetical protein
MKVPWRLRWAWKIMVAAYVGLGAASWGAYRSGERWAWIANWIPFLYGVPVMTIDSVYVGFWSTAVAPQLAGALVAATGLLLPADLFWRDTPSRGTVSNVVTR